MNCRCTYRFNESIPLENAFGTNCFGHGQEYLRGHEDTRGPLGDGIFTFSERALGTGKVLSSEQGRYITLVRRRGELGGRRSEGRGSQTKITDAGVFLEI